MSGGFVAEPGTTQTGGDLPAITAALDKLGRKLGQTIYGISGGRTPGHSIAVGGFADDPHTKDAAEDIGVGAPTLASAAQISDAQLASVGLYRPFKTGAEINHVQLISSKISQPAPAAARAAARLEPSGGVSVGKLVTNAVQTSVNPVGAIAHAANSVTGGAASDAAQGVAKDAVDYAGSQALGWLKSDGARLLLEVTLILGGALVMFTGAAQLAGTKPTTLARAAAAAAA